MEYNRELIRRQRAVVKALEDIKQFKIDNGDTTNLGAVIVLMKCVEQTDLLARIQRDTTKREIKK